jgi:hypothetical protein
MTTCSCAFSSGELPNAAPGDFSPAILLAALPLAAVPVIIHLIHLYRRRQVKWAAMMFLLAAQRMNKGFTRLRQILILALRVLAVAALIFVITRPLAGGWLGLTGGAPDTLLILLDRSASMEQHNPATGISKRVAGLQNIAKAIDDAVGTRSQLVLIDSATAAPQTIDRAGALLDLPTAGPTRPRQTSRHCCRARWITSRRTKPAAQTSGCSAICSRRIGMQRAGAGRRCGARSLRCKACAFICSRIRKPRPMISP